MKLDHFNSDVEVIGAKGQKSLTIKNDSKLFSLMIDSLYKDKYGSVVRELAANGYDEHVTSGIEDTPLEITIPDDFNPEFKIRDFGRGLSSDEILRFFGQLLDSSKDDSNEVRGAFGLGCKSPFSIVDSFTVRSIKNGIETICVLARENKGTPTIAVISERETDEVSGTEVTILDEDSDAWITAIRNQLSIYPVKPRLNLPISWIEFTKFGNISYSDDSINDEHIFIDMGHVLYPVKESDMPIAFFEHAGDGCIVYHVPIGGIDIPPDRERIELTKKTIECLKSTIESSTKSVIDQISSDLKRLDSRTYNNIKKYAKDIELVPSNSNKLSTIFDLVLDSLDPYEFFTKQDYDNFGLKHNVKSILNSTSVLNSMSLIRYTVTSRYFERDRCFSLVDIIPSTHIAVNISRSKLVNDILMKTSSSVTTIASVKKTEIDEFAIDALKGFSKFVGGTYTRYDPIKVEKQPKKKSDAKNPRKLKAKHLGIYIGNSHMTTADIDLIESGEYIKIVRNSSSSMSYNDYIPESVIAALVRETKLPVVYMTPNKSAIYSHKGVISYDHAIKNSLLSFDTLFKIKNTDKSLYRELKRLYNGTVIDVINQNKDKYVENMKRMVDIGDANVNLASLERKLSHQNFSSREVYNVLMYGDVINKTNIDSILESIYTATI